MAKTDTKGIEASTDPAITLRLANSDIKTINTAEITIFR